MTVSEFQSRRILRISIAVAHFISTTPEDRLSWEPDGLNGAKGRNIFSMASEIVIVNSLVSGLLAGTITEPIKPSEHLPPINFVDSADAQAQILSSGETLADTVRNMSESDIENVYPHWAGPLKGEILIEMTYRNMAYHAGQINFIQILLGDSEFHVPPGTWR